MNKTRTGAGKEPDVRAAEGFRIGLRKVFLTERSGKRAGHTTRKRDPTQKGNGAAHRLSAEAAPWKTAKPTPVNDAGRA